jgi:hypothetical protein
MSIKIPPEVRAAMQEIARKFGSQGGKAAAKNMTPAQRKARSKKAAKAATAAAKRRKAERLAREAVSKKATQKKG